MINLLNRKNLLALFLGLACLSANSAWGMGRKNVNLLTAALRDIAIGTEMYAEHKYGADSKAALASGIATNVARLLNDISSQYNLYKKVTSVDFIDYLGEEECSWNNYSTLAPMALSLMDIIIKSKKFINKKGSFTEKQQNDTQAHVSKIIEKLHKYTPVAEMILVAARSASLKWKVYNKKTQGHCIYFSTVFLNLARATQVIAQSKMDKSNMLLAAGVGTAALAVLAVLLDLKDGYITN